MKKLISYSCAIFVFMGTLIGQAQSTQIIAHRGFWKTENNAQNSLTSLEKAAQLKLYGSEFDVHLTKDGVLVVNHDKDINGQIIESTNYNEFADYRLNNGEKLPTLEAYLKRGKKYPDLKLIVEIKAHSTAELETKVVEKIIELVEKVQVENQVEYISFSPHMCNELKRIRPMSSVVYLNGDLSPAEVKKKGWDGIDYHYKVYQKNEQWISQAHALGLTTNVWTVNSIELMQQMQHAQVQFISTDQPLELLELMK